MQDGAEKIGDLFGKVAKRAEKFLNREVSSQQKPLSEDELRDIMRRQQDLLAKLMESPFSVGTIVGSVGDVTDERSLLIMSINGRLALVNQHPKEVCLPGDCVKVAPETGQIVGKIDDIAVGNVCIVKSIPDNGLVEVDNSGTTKIVLAGRFFGKIEEEDRVVLDPSGHIVIGHLGKGGKRFKLQGRPTVTWDDIGGLDEAKLQMIEAIEWPVKYAKKYEYHKKKPLKGALIIGPPGCGKTMLVEAAATSIMSLHGDQSLDGYYMIKGPEVLDMYVGVAERAIRQIFSLAKKYKQRTGLNAVIVIDEAEALLSKRGSGKSSDMEKTIVPTFLTEMQGVDESGATVFVLTNRVDILDPAVTRDGRLDRTIYVSRPDRKSARKIFELAFNGKPLETGVDNLQMAEFAVSEFYSEKYKIYDVKKNDGTILPFGLANLVNGAMLVGVADRASSLALRRDIDNDTESPVTKADVSAAVEKAFNEKIHLNHSDELQEFVRDFRDELALDPVQRVRQASKP